MRVSYSTILLNCMNVQFRLIPNKNESKKLKREFKISTYTHKIHFVWLCKKVTIFQRNTPVHIKTTQYITSFVVVVTKFNRSKFMSSLMGIYNNNSEIDTINDLIRSSNGVSAQLNAQKIVIFPVYLQLLL